MTDRIKLVCATRQSEQTFASQSALGQSLARIKDGRVDLHIAYQNTHGLPAIYNHVIDLIKEDDAVLVFIHDDIWLDDFYFRERVLEGLAQYDVIGLAGNRRRFQNQVAWLDLKGEWKDVDRNNHSGAVAHGKSPFGPVARYGPVPAECELLDGLMLAVRVDTLRRHSVRFDTRFRFHLYDLDFCRTARQAGLRLATWPIAVTHQSAGNYNSPAWEEAAHRYLAKWGD